MDVDINKINFEKVITESIDKSLVGLGLIGVTQARIAAPVDTGLLSNSITYATKYEQSEAGSIGSSIPEQDDLIEKPTGNHTMYIGTNVEYAAAVEYGYEDGSRDPDPYMLIAKKKVEATIKKGFVKKQLFKDMQNYARTRAR